MPCLCPAADRGRHDPTCELATQQQQREQASLARQPSAVSFRDALTSLINSYNREQGSNTPDMILAQYVLDSLAAFDKATVRRDVWYGGRRRPGHEG